MKIKTYVVANKAQGIITTVLDYGDLKGKEGWEEAPFEFHIQRAIGHLQEAKGESFAHALTRIAMAIALKDHCSESKQGGAE